MQRGKHMNLIKITDLTNNLGISSRSLRYYEQMGLIKSVRPEFEKYRFFDAENIERLKQIIILRKMQIPIKDTIKTNPKNKNKERRAYYDYKTKQQQTADYSQSYHYALRRKLLVQRLHEVFNGVS